MAFCVHCSQQLENISFIPERIWTVSTKLSDIFKGRDVSTLFPTSQKGGNGDFLSESNYNSLTRSLVFSDRNINQQTNMFSEQRLSSHGNFFQFYTFSIIVTICIIYL